MENIEFITLEEVLRVHRGLIEAFGGDHGIRDDQLLDSAINMPKSSFSNKYLHKDIFEMAAAYAYHIIKNHPFIDGKKRTGIFIAILFLENNDIEINFKKGELYKLGTNIATSEISKEEIAKIFNKKSILN